MNNYEKGFIKRAEELGYTEKQAAGGMDILKSLFRAKAAPAAYNTATAAAQRKVEFFKKILEGTPRNSSLLSENYNQVDKALRGSANLREGFEEGTRHAPGLPQALIGVGAGAGGTAALMSGASASNGSSSSPQPQSGDIMSLLSKYSPELAGAGGGAALGGLVGGMSSKQNKGRNAGLGALLGAGAGGLAGHYLGQ